MHFVEEKPPSAGRLGSVEIHPKTAYSYQADEFVFGFAFSALRSNTEK
jgi:hypothetical protein